MKDWVPIYRKMESTLLKHGEWFEDKIDESHGEWLEDKIDVSRIHLTTLLKNGEWLEDKIDESHVHLTILLVC